MKTTIDTINLSDIISLKLIKKAKKYKEDEYSLFLAELGWEDWMAELIGVESTEKELTEREIEIINEYLSDIWTQRG